MAYAMSVDVFEAIGDPTRRKIIELVADTPRAAGSIAGEFLISRPGVSQHLAVLTNCGVLHVHTQGRSRIYSLNQAALAEPRNWLEDQRNRWNTALDRLESEMNHEEENPDG